MDGFTAFRKGLLPERTRPRAVQTFMNARGEESTASARSAAAALEHDDGVRVH